MEVAGVPSYSTHLGTKHHPVERDSWYMDLNWIRPAPTRPPPLPPAIPDRGPVRRVRRRTARFRQRTA